MQQQVLAAVAAVGGRIGKMLVTVDFHGDAGGWSVVAQKIHLQLPPAIERDRQHRVEAETSPRLRQGLKAVVQEGLTHAPGPRPQRRTPAAGRRGQKGSPATCPRRPRPAPAHTARVVTLPCGIGGQRYVLWPTGNGARRQHDRVVRRLIAAAAPVEHPRKHMSTTGINRPLRSRRNPATFGQVNWQKCRHKPATP